MPLNERIAFIRNPDQMQVKLSTAKQSYKTREKVEIEVEAKDQSGKPVAGNFSVSVIDESKVPVDEARYDHPKTDMELPDLRSTIYWNPAIKTTSDGKTKFDFFNAHDAGNYKVIIEGINAEGE